MQSDHDASRVTFWEQDNETILEQFDRDTAGDSGKTAKTYGSRIRAALRRAERRKGEPVALRDVISNPNEMVDFLTDSSPLRGNREASVDTMRGLRTAMKKFVSWAPPSSELTRATYRDVLRQAQIRASKTRGTKRILTPGRRKERFRGRPPTVAAIEAVLAVLFASPLEADRLVGELVRLLYLTGTRVTSVLALNRADLVRREDGVWIVRVTEKSHDNARFVPIPRKCRSLIDTWEPLPPDVPLWCSGSRRLTRAQAAAIIERACAVAGVVPFLPHDVRRAFASDVAPRLGAGGLQSAGNWSSQKTMERYVYRREQPDA